jgi:hypothetical protein
VDLKLIEDGAAAASVAWLSLTGLVYAVVFLSDHRKPAHGWLALQSLLSCAFPAWVLGLSPELLSADPVHLVGAAVPMACVASVYFTHAHFGARRPGPAWLALFLLGPGVVTLANAGVVGAGMPALVTGVVVALAVVHQVELLARLASRGAMNARVFLVCWLLVGGGAVVDLVAGAHLSVLTLTAFSFLLTVALAREHLSQQRRNEHLQDQLEQRLEMIEASHQEIALLNSELRRQIGLRSRQLAQALARLGTGAALPDGELVGGRYRVVRPLGSGSMGDVYEVARVADGRRFALKLLHGDADRDVRVRFAREAQILSQLDHPNLVAIVDIDVTERDELYLVMDLVEGTTLERARGRGRDLDWIVSALRQVAAGLAAIHRAGVIHRDLKPGNILVAARRGGSLVKIADFGVSSLNGKRELCDTQPIHLADEGTTAHATRRGVVVGTPSYMAPELADCVDATFAVDIFSFGVLAYELCAGQRPFAEPAFTRRLLGAAIDAPAPLHTVAPQLPAALAALLDSCLDPQPRRRPTAATLAAALAEQPAVAARPEVASDVVTLPN